MLQGHHVDLQIKMSNFAASLLAAHPPISGLDKSIIIPGRRLHFTLGVMSLESSVPSGSSSGSPEKPTIQAAIALLQSLKPHIDKILAKSPSGSELPLGTTSHPKLSVVLNAMDVMKLEKNEMAHVVWIGPADGNSKNAAQWETRRLTDVCDFIHNSFKRAGFILDDRPLKLHCTVINTVYRKPKPRDGKRMPFSYRELLNSSWFFPQSSSHPYGSVVEGSTAAAETSLSRSPVAFSTSASDRLKNVDFGIWDIEEAQICEMGSWGTEGEYISVGSIPLV